MDAPPSLVLPRREAPATMRSAARGRFAVHCVVAAANSALDVLLKTGVIVFAAYHGGVDARTLSLVAALSWALFMAPFFLLSAHGGAFGDRFDNRRLALVLKGCDVVIAAVAAWGFWSGNIALLLGVVFAKGCTASLFSPIKYSLVAALLPPARRGAGYAVLEAVSMIAILGGTYLGAVLGAAADPRTIGLTALALAGTALAAAGLYPQLVREGPRAPLPGLDPVRPALEILRTAHANRPAFGAILALSWFWALGAVFLANAPGLVRGVFHGGASLVALVLTAFTLGVSLGLAGSAWLSRAHLAAGRVGLITAALIAAMGLGLAWPPAPSAGRALSLFFGIALASGLYAGGYSEMLYGAAGERDEARLFAANNIVSSLVMVLALGLSALILALGAPVAACLAGFAAASVPVTLAVGALGRR